MTIGPDGMRILVGTLVVQPELLDLFTYHLDEFIKKISDKELSEDEEKFLKNAYITDMIKDFVYRIGIKYEESGGVIDKRK